MTTVSMIAEEEATGRVLEIYEDIMRSLGTDFVLNLGSYFRGAEAGIR